MTTALSARSIQTLLEAALAKAEELDIRVAVAVVDAGGALAGYLRMPGAFLISSELAIDKAWTASGFAASTRDVGAMLDKQEAAVRDGLLARPRVTIVPGGLPLSAEGICVGGIGVSGGSAEQDELIATTAATMKEKGHRVTGTPIDQDQV